MKLNKVIILLTIPLLSLASCNNNNTDVLEASKEAVKNLQQVVSTKYSLTVTGNISIFDTFEDPEPSYDVPKGIIGDTGYSYILRTPLLLNEETYYPDDADLETVDTSQYGYFKITSRLLWEFDSKTSLRFETRDDNLVFSVEGLSKNLVFYHVLTDPDNMLYSEVQIYARFDITLVYNSEGLLIEETIKSQNPLSDSKEKTVDVKTTYSYS